MLLLVYPKTPKIDLTTFTFKVFSSFFGRHFSLVEEVHWEQEMIDGF